MTVSFEESVHALAVRFRASRTKSEQISFEELQVQIAESKTSATQPARDPLLYQAADAQSCSILTTLSIEAACSRRLRHCRPRDGRLELTFRRRSSLLARRSPLSHRESPAFPRWFYETPRAVLAFTALSSNLATVLHGGARDRRKPAGWPYHCWS